VEFAIQLGGGQVRHAGSGIEAIVAEARLAEDLGFGIAFVPDHYVFEAIGNLQWDTPAYELFTVLATLAQRTSTIRLGSHVACMLFRHPAMHARLFAQIDEASGGRVIAGVGAGWTRAEFEMMGIEFPDVSTRLAMMDEAVAIMRALWRDERVTYQGKHYQVRDAVCLPKPAQPNGPPIMLGGSGTGILRRAGEWADIVHMVPQLGKAGTTTVDEIAKFGDAAVATKLARVRTAEATAGRPAGATRFATTVFNYVPTASPAETTTAAEGLSGIFGVGPDELRRHPVSLMGTPEEMIDEIRRREDVHGLSMLAVNFSTQDQVRAFGERVVARLAS